MLHAKNGCLRLTAGEIDYIRFGTGERPLVMLPGVGTGVGSGSGSGSGMGGGT